MHFKKLRLTPAFAFAFAMVILIAGCSKDDVLEIIGVCPIVLSTVPEDGDINVPLDQVISVTFNEELDPVTVNEATFTVEGSSSIAGTVTYSDETAYFTPEEDLLPNTTYTGTVTTGIKDPMGNAVQEDYVWSFTTVPQLSLSATPEAGGTVTGEGTFDDGSTVTVNATPNDGFTFTNWSVDGTVVSTSSSYQFEMDGNIALVANFEEVVLGNFRINLSSSPIAGGTTTGSGQFSENSTVTVSALPNSGYVFINWTEGETVVSTSSSYQFVLTENRTLVANYSEIPADQFAVVLSATPSAGGTVNGSGSFDAATDVTVTADANTGYAFVNWTVNGAEVSTDSDYTFELTETTNLVANFEVRTYSLNITAQNGSVAKDPNEDKYDSGAEVVLTATPEDGYEFSSWSGDASGTSNPFTVTMDGDKDITANFTPIQSAYTLNVTAQNGSVSKNSDQQTYNDGDEVVLTATPEDGYEFSSWSGDARGSENPLTVTMDSDKDITANFTQVNNAAAGPGVIDLGTAGDFVILSKSGISNTGETLITGNIGVSPIDRTALTGFSEIMDVTNEFSRSIYVVGKIYAADYAVPTPAYLSTAISDQETAFTTANGLTTNVIADLGAGDISGMTLAPGLYKWDTGLLITNAGVTLEGGPDDTWVFQISSDFTIDNTAKITLAGGAQAKNIFWITSTQALLGSDVQFKGNILAKTLISVNTGAMVSGRLLSQTAVTLNANTVTKP